MSESKDDGIIIKKNHTYWVTLVIFIILGLATIIMTGMALRGGDKLKGIIWILYILSIIAFIGTCILILKKHKEWAVIVLIITFVLNLIALILTNNAGNVSQTACTTQEYKSGHLTTIGKYAGAVGLTVALLFGLIPIYYI